MGQDTGLRDLALVRLAGAVRVSNGDRAGPVVHAQLAALVLGDAIDVVVHVAVNEVNPAVLLGQCVAVSTVDPHRLRPPDLADDMVLDSERPPYDSPNQHVLLLALYTQILRTSLYRRNLEIG